MESLELWLGIPGAIEQSIEGLDDAGLDLRGGSENWSIREWVHHLVEANLVASNMILAALARDGIAYDWTWVTPNGAWNRRMGYDRAPVQPALLALRAVGEHLASLIETAPGSLERKVQLRDTPDGEPYTKTVGGILEQEVEHASEHLPNVTRIRAAAR